MNSVLPSTDTVMVIRAKTAEEEKAAAEAAATDYDPVLYRVPDNQTPDEFLTQMFFPGVTFEMVPLPNGYSLWMDENGAYTLPRNKKAEKYFGEHVHGGKLHGLIVCAPPCEE